MLPLAPTDPERVGGYLLLARLGSGGMGEVFCGRSPGGRTVAIKVVHEDLAGDPEFRARFAREVAAARTVGGAFTAPVIDADTGAPRPWLVTAYLLGGSLREVVAEAGPLPPPSVYALGSVLAEALTAIHRAGVVHRDLTPANVLLTTEGPRVIDFGIARAADAVAVTRTGTAIGSPGYAAPEQATGGAVGPAGDVFSLGATLAFAATGAPPYGEAPYGEAPYGEAPPHVLVRRTPNERPALDGVPDPALRDLIARCLDRDPARRPEPRLLLDSFGARLPGGVVLGGTSWLPGPAAAAVARRAAQAPPPGAAPYRTAERGHRLGRRGFLAAGVTAAALAAAGGVAAAELTGGAGSRRIWTRKLSGEVSAGPWVSGGLLLVWDTTSSDLTALDARTGRYRWHTGIDSVSSYPLVSGGMLLIGGVDAADQALIGVDAATGDYKWSVATVSGISGGLTTVAAGTGLAYLVAGYRSSSTEQPVLGVDVRTGQTVWTYSFDTVGDAGRPAYSGGLVHVCYSDGYLYTLDAASGRLRWRRRLARPREMFGRDLLFSLPAVAGGVVYVVSNRDRVHALRAATGDPLWTAAIGGAAHNTQLVPGPMVAGDVVLAGGTDGILYAVGARDGRPRWHRAVDRSTGWWSERPDWLWPPVTGGVALVIGEESTWYGVDLASGRVRWRRPGAKQAAAVAAGGLFHAYASEHDVVSLDPATGRTVRYLFRGSLSHVPGGTLAVSGDVVYLYAGFPGEPTTYYAFRAR